MTSDRPAAAGELATYEIGVLDDAGAAEWDAFVAACPQATFFHRAGWRTVIERSFGQHCRFLKATRDGAIHGVLPLVLVKSRLFGTRWVSTGWCVGGSTAVDEPAAALALDRAAQALLAQSPAEYIEYRDPPNPHTDGAWKVKDGIYASFERPIEADEDACLKQIPRKQRAVVRKAIESTLVDRIDQDPTSFYQLYSLSMRNLGTPVFSRKYIKTLLEVFGPDADILTVYQDDRPLSSVLNFYFRDKVMPYYTGADPEARKLGAADLMYFRVMRRASARGYRVFDFGRSKLDTGPYAFKKNWGFEPRPVVHEFFLKDGVAMPDVNPNNPKYQRKIEAWKRLPLPIANLIGPWFGRQVG
ncbi:FemAB family XrtA/PEP-CTERM system-associated protein [Aliidongia dinghuensis]|uniref:FemAB family XrtA/PEP-CTERM system-associated protein n=1 Tax=Aliidongia dinghuensis TaxID=1867774 RepID=UPI001667842F|nr:FemAB family XrtA/PEP-CTERM system-associated protein [Aliidongia dinghuensis]